MAVPSLGHLARLWQRARFWEDEYSLTALLVMLVLTLFVVTPLCTSAIFGSQVLLGFLAVLTVTGVAAVSGRRSITSIAVLLALAGIGLDWAAHFGHQTSLWVLDNVSRLLFVLMLGVMVTARVFRRGNVTYHRVQGAICVYLLAGLAWAYSYEILVLVNHTAFRVTEDYASHSARVGLFRYFSFVTLTTLGYGDVLPVSPLARSLATAEALFGQLYPAVMIARLISLEIFERTRREPRA
jgi:hypothetical protein